ncbi:MAG: hypothetical protein K0R41_3186 [Geminicoccaceae bacterium]|jgi:hypothetical protein|nr:hypothetical protein [Geminicoccaceae bacterium]
MAGEADATEPRAAPDRCAMRSAGRERKVAERSRTDGSSAQARAAIDRGETGDKIAHPDPATAPLGTEAEAGGAATPGEPVAPPLGAQNPSPAARAMAEAPRAAPRRRYVPWLVAGLAVAIAAIAALAIAA